MLSALIKFFLPIFNGADSSFSLFNTFLHFLVLEFDKSSLLIFMRVSVSKTSFKSIVTSVCFMFVDRRFILWHNTFEHGLVGEFDIKLAQMRQVFLMMCDIVIVNCVSHGLRRLAIDAAFDFIEVVVVRDFVLEVQKVLTFI